MGFLVIDAGTSGVKSTLVRSLPDNSYEVLDSKKFVRPEGVVKDPDARIWDARELLSVLSGK